MQVPLSVVLPRQVHDPVAGALGHIEVASVIQQLIAVQESMADEGRPDDDRFVLSVASRPARERKVIRPAVFLELGRLVLHEPLKTADGLFSVVLVSRAFQQRQVSPGHVAPALRRFQGFDTQKGPEVDGGLADELQQDPIRKQTAECEGPKKGRKPVEGFISPIIAILDPLLQSAETVRNLDPRLIRHSFTRVSRVPPAHAPAIRAGLFRALRPRIRQVVIPRSPPCPCIRLLRPPRCSPDIHGPSENRTRPPTRGAPPIRPRISMRCPRSASCPAPLRSAEGERHSRCTCTF